MIFCMTAFAYFRQCVFSEIKRGPSHGLRPQSCQLGADNYLGDVRFFLSRCRSSPWGLTRAFFLTVAAYKPAASVAAALGGSQRRFQRALRSSRGPVKESR